MIHGIKYNEVTGEIIMSISSSDHEGISIQAQDGCPTMETEARVNDAESYVVSGEVVTRPTMPLVINTTSFAVAEIINVTGIPVGTTLYYPGGELVIDDGYFEWSSVESGEFKFTLANFPHRLETINATVTAA